MRVFSSTMKRFFKAMLFLAPMMLMILALTPQPASAQDVAAINAGGTATGSFVADVDYSGGSTSTTTKTISLTGVTNPAPQAVYQSERNGNSTYTIPGLVAGSSYTIRLHFAEHYWNSIGQRVFNVSINGTQVLTNFDIIKAAGGPEIANVQQFTANANTSGQMVIKFTTVTDNAAINGIEIAPAGGGGTGNCSTVSNLTVGGTTYTPTWCQEFNGAAGPPDTSVWNFGLGGGGWGNGEAQVYCGPPGYANNPSQCPTTFSTSTSNAYIDGSGHLVIQPLKVNGTWLSARMSTSGKQTFTYGILEASIELPDTTNQGLWPAFWTLGNNINTGVSWPTCGEEDIMEDWSPQVHNGLGTTGDVSTVHTAKTGGGGVGGHFTFPSGQAGNTAYHVYGIIWKANQVQTFVDNASSPFLTITPSSLPSGDTWPFNQGMFTILNVAVGGTLGGSDSGLTSPAQPMKVNYVRWYTPQ